MKLKTKLRRQVQKRLLQIRRFVEESLFSPAERKILSDKKNRSPIQLPGTAPTSKPMAKGSKITSSLPNAEAVATAQTYFAQLSDFHAFAEASKTPEFYDHFANLLDSLPDNQKQLLYKRARQENQQFAQLLDQKKDFLEALKALNPDDIPHLQLFGIGTTEEKKTN